MSLPAPVDDNDETDVAAEVGGDLRRTLGRYLDYVVREWRLMLAQVEQKQRGYVPPGERDDLALMRDFTRSAVDAFTSGRAAPAGSTTWPRTSSAGTT